MKLRWCVVIRPLCLIVFLTFAVLMLAGFLIPLGMKMTNRIKKESELVSLKINQELLSGIQNTATLFSSFSASASSLARILKSSLREHDFHDFNMVKTKVASNLFQSLSTIPYLSEISYIGLDGLFIGYYSEDNQSFALYSNSTLSDTKNSTWYRQPANRENGNLYGKAITYPPFASINSSWFQSALNSTSGYCSVGKGWGKSPDTFLLSTVPLNGSGAISLAFSIKSLIDLLSTQVALYNGILYMATKDGIMLTQGFPHTHIMFSGNQIQFQSFSVSDDQVVEFKEMTCGYDFGALRQPTLRILDKNYVINCSAGQIAGLQLLYVVALPHEELSGLIQRTTELAFLLLLLMIGAMFMTLCTFFYLIIGATRREMYLRRALIRQMEATQQAERKSMNKSLAFASASHDIRAFLAGITGLIEICLNEVSERNGPSEFQTNLLQMQICTTDLLGILNSILDTTKIEAGKMQLDEVEFDIEQLLEDVVDLFHPVGMKKGVDVIFDPSDGTVRKSSRVKGDQGKLKQILCNLLSNAIKFTPEGSVTVRALARKPTFEKEILASNRNNLISCLFCVSCKADETYSESEVVNSIQRDPNCMEFVFEVNDTGKGIPKEKKKSVFENYVQLKGSAAGHAGTGLGLGIVQSLVRLMGGEIRIVDKEVGDKGSLFRFNVFISACEADMSMNGKEVDVEVIGDHVMSDSVHHSSPLIRNRSPKAEGSHVILFIQSAKRSTVIQTFMERLGIKVHVVKQHEQLSPTLKKIKNKLSLSRYSSSGKSDVNSRSDGCISSASSKRLKELPLSAQDGTYGVLPSQRKANGAGGFWGFVLIVVDIRAGPLLDISRAVAEFRGDLDNSGSNAVVWLDNSSVGDNNSSGLGELPPSDLVISKPFHGSRLYLAISLLPEFRTTMSQPMSPRLANARNTCSGEASPSIMKEIVSLPSPAHKRCEIEEVEEPNNRKPLAGKKFLVADDDSIGRKIAMMFTTQLGASVSSCENGEEAWKLVCKGLDDGGTSTNSLPYDCILMDCQMQVMDGTEATRRIRETERKFGVHIPIIALTAHEKGEEINMMKEAGVDGYLTKPLKKEDLLKSLSELEYLLYT